MNKKILFFLIWVLFFIAGPLIVIKNSNIDSILSNRILLANFAQRILGMSAFGLLAFQITLGGNMDIWRKNIGSWVLSFHKNNGMLVYFLIFLHPSAWIVFNYFLKGNINPYYPFVDVCLLCKGINEYYINFGRLAFWSITLAVVAARLITYIDDKWLRQHWRKIHIFNYLAFYFVTIHAVMIGSDIRGILSITFLVFCNLLVALTIVRRLKRSDLKSELLKILN